jgi:chorismate dehydratase
MKKLLRISAVSYINAQPFVYGIERSGLLENYSLSLDIPSVCAEKLIKGKVDIGLAPVAILPRLKRHFLFPDFCIGADGAVTSVMLYSQVPLKDIKSIYLDNQSRTSVILVQVLCRFFWKVTPHFIHAKPGYEKKINKTSAGLIIGDRNFFLKKKFKYVYDLSEEWKNFTGLPFVFACWISTKKLNSRRAKALYKALQFGLDNRNDVLSELPKKYDKKKMGHYLNHSISYYFDPSKQQALDLFLKLGKEIGW